MAYQTLELRISKNIKGDKFVGIKREPIDKEDESKGYKLVFYAPMGFYSKNEAEFYQKLFNGFQDFPSTTKENDSANRNALIDDLISQPENKTDEEKEKLFDSSVKKAREKLFDDLKLIVSLIGKKAKKDRDDLHVHGRSPMYTNCSFPFQAYVYIIQNYLEFGLYRERETEYKTGLYGKINWGRTIKTKQAYISGKNAYYLDFVTKKYSFRNDLLITLIHEAVVYECFGLLGGFFTDYMPPKPQKDLEANRDMFISFLKNKIITTYRDREKELFNNMLAVLEETVDFGKSRTHQYGINEFEYVWEYAVDAVFGISEGEKDKYSPRAFWYFENDPKGKKARDDEDEDEEMFEGKRKPPLRPDTIMKHGTDLYILDAKYYRFGKDKTAEVQTLPGTDSVQKQITYAEYAEKQKEKGELTGFGDIWNAFIMPFNYEDNKDKFGEVNNSDTSEQPSIKYWFKQKALARAEWKENDKNYHTVYGICADVRGLLEAADKGGSEQEKKALAGFLDACKYCKGCKDIRSCTKEVCSDTVKR